MTLSISKLCLALVALVLVWLTWDTEAYQIPATGKFYQAKNVTQTFGRFGARFEWLKLQWTHEAIYLQGHLKIHTCTGYDRCHQLIDKLYRNYKIPIWKAPPPSLIDPAGEEDAVEGHIKKCPVKTQPWGPITFPNHQIWVKLNHINIQNLWNQGEKYASYLLCILASLLKSGLLPEAFGTVFDKGLPISINNLLEHGIA